MLLCECSSVLAGHCVVWLSDSHSLKVWLFVSNLFATPVLEVPRENPFPGLSQLQEATCIPWFVAPSSYPSSLCFHPHIS